MQSEEIIVMSRNKTMILHTFLFIFLFTKKVEPLVPFHWVPFNEGMATSSNYNIDFAEADVVWQLARNSYDRFVADCNSSFIRETSIPKIIHHIWLGSPLPEKYIYFINSWKKHHPDWQYILWTDKEVEALNLVNKARYKATKNMGERGDIAGYEIIYRFGGLYVDTDFECLKPFDVFHQYCDFYTGITADTHFGVYTGLFAAKPGDPILKHCIEQLHLSTKPAADIYEVLENTGPLFLTKCVKALLPTLNNRSVFFPLSYFYPWPGSHRLENTRAEIEKWFKPESFAVHHWHTTWQ